MTTTPDTQRRERIVAAIWPHLPNGVFREEVEAAADAVIAAEQGHAAEVRAAALNEAADFFESTSRIRTQFFGHQVGPILRGMAAAVRPETEAHPAAHTWAVELYDPLADQWAPGTRYTARESAVNHLHHANTIGPTWKDGTPVQRRLVRSTTTHTVEQHAAAARPDNTTGA